MTGYYAACRDRNALVASLLQKRFPEVLGGLSPEEIYGVGPFKVKPMACPIIEVAADGETAKGLWCCQGAYNDVEACGPVAHWHLLYVNDVDCICGQSWGRPQKPYPALPEFAPLADFRYPPYTTAATVREPYSPTRPLTPAPEIPAPYATFAETFSYGI